MTRQIDDKFWYQNSEFQVSLVENTIPFNIKDDLGLNPVAPHTACWRGFYVEFDLIKEKEFVIRDLYVHQEGDEYPEINGVTPYSNDDFFKYTNVNIPIKYTGKITIGKTISEGFEFQHSCASMYETVFELFLENGKLIDAIDISKKMKTVRDKEKGFFKRIKNLLMLLI